MSEMHMKPSISRFLWHRCLSCGICPQVKKYKNHRTQNLKHKSKRQERHLNISALKKECLISHTLIYIIYSLHMKFFILKMSILKYKGLKTVNRTEDADMKWRCKPPSALKNYINTFISSFIKISWQEIIKSH